MDEWLQKQVNKYANIAFGEADMVVDRKLKAYLKLFDFAKKDMTFLDLGTNSGRVAYEMQKIGLKELGVDLPEVITKIKYPINKTAMNLEEDFPKGQWDLIFCRETIEHLRNYKEVCKKIINALSASGVLIITAPNNKRDMGKNCPEHVRVFEGTQLDKLVTNNGGKIVEKFNEKRQRVIVARK